MGGLPRPARKDLVFLPVFLAQVGLTASLSSYTEPPAYAIGLPFLVTVAYAVWSASYVPAFVGGFISAWAFPTAVFLWYLLGTSHSIIAFPPEGFIFFLGLGTVYGLLGLLVVKIVDMVGGREG